MTSTGHECNLVDGSAEQVAQDAMPQATHRVLTVSSSTALRVSDAPQVADIVVLSPILKRFMPSNVICTLEARPFPGEPAGTTTTERSALWLATMHGHMNGGSPSQNLEWTTASKVLNNIHEFLFVGARISALSSVVCAAYVFLNWQSYSLLSLSTVVLLSTATTGMGLGLVMTHMLSPVEDAQKLMQCQLQWTRMIMDVLVRLHGEGVELSPLLRVLMLAMKDSVAGRMSMMRRMSPSDQVAMMRLAQSLSKVRRGPFSKKASADVDGDMSEVIHRALDAMDIDAMQALSDTDTISAHVISVDGSVRMPKAVTT